MPMANHWLNCLAVVILHALVRRGRAIIEVIADLVTPEDLWRNHPRANVPAPIAENKAVKTVFVRSPIFARWHENRPSGRSDRAPENERMDPGAVQHCRIRHLPRTFFHDNTGDSAACEEHGYKRTRENFGSHRSGFGNKQGSCEAF
jgi:hypothetical protein